MVRAIWPLLLVAVAVLSACGGATGVHGRVKDGEANEPLAGAKVELLRCTQSGCEETVGKQTTGTDGRWAFPDAEPGKYLLSIVWSSPPDCPGIQPFDTLGTSGEFLVTLTGYGGLGGTGPRSMLAVQEFELTASKGKKLDLEFSCP